jgi:steroid 5-alpha reductase family enzyme
MSERFKAVLWLVIAYACTLAAGVSVYTHALMGDPLWDMVLADVAGTTTIFLFSMLFRNSSFYDPYWSGVPIAIAWGWHVSIVSPDHETRSLVMQGLIALWGLRLTYNFLRGFDNLEHCDWRYRDLETKYPRVFWLVSFSGIHFFPSFLVFLGLVPVYLAMGGGDALFGVWDGLAAVLTLTGILLEAISDQQLHRFVQTNDDPQRFIDTGLWAYSRHPNYLGEVTFWWGLALFGATSTGLVGWSIAGAVAMTLLFVFISIPMMDKRMLRKRPHYAAHMRRVSRLLLLPPRRLDTDAP